MHLQTKMKLFIHALVSGILLGWLSIGRETGHGAAGARMREITVRPSATGAPVIAAALASAPPESTVRLRKGIYHETITLSKPVSLVGEEGAVIDPSEPFRPQWQPFPALGKGVYRAASDRRPQSLLLDGKILAALDERRTQRVPAQRVMGPWFW